MKRKALTMTLIAMTLLTSTIAFAYYVSTNQLYEGENFLPTASPTPTESPSPIPTPTSPNSPSPSPTSSPTIGGSFGPLGGFRVTSPSNKTYSSNTLTLAVTGHVIVGRNVELFMTYSLDGQESLPLPIEIKREEDRFSFFGLITGSVALPQLSEGSHSVTVFGDLNAYNHLAIATVYFTVHGS